MITFKEYIIEAIRQSDFPKAANLIHKYFTKHLGKTYFFPTPEVFSSRNGSKQIGIKFFVKGNKAVRLNWTRAGVKMSAGLTSIDYWDGSKSPQPYPSRHIQFDETQSLTTVLPFIVDFIDGKVTESGVYVEDDTDNSLTEAVYTEQEISKTVTNVINAFKSGIQVRQQYAAGGKKKYGPRWDEVQKAAKDLYPNLFKKQGVAIVIDIDDAAKLDHNRILAAVTAGKGSIKFDVSPGVTETVEVEGASAQDLDRMTYEEQLDALKTGMKLLMSNATNAIFLGGRGGTGKTQTVEDMLHAAGKTDGEGYFKITGSATPTGIYRILYTHRKDIVLFDDSDSALADQEGRNLFKAASDTKKSRKISWMKGGKNFVDPAEYDEEGDNDTLPRYFEFTGKIIFISNMPLNKLDPDGALRTRGFVINVDPTNEEIYDFMLKIVDKIPLDVNYPLDTAARMEVVEVLRSRKVADKTANLRSLVRGLNTRAGVESQGGSQAEWMKFVKMFA